MNPKDMLNAPFSLSEFEAHTITEMAHALKSFQAQFPGNYTSIAIAPDQQHLIAEVLIAGAKALRVDNESS